MLTRIANLLSLSRILFAALLTILYLMDASSFVLVFCCATLWLTDFFDGRAARADIKRGAKPSVEGKLLDPLMDDVGLYTGFLILVDAQQVPIWFVIFLFISRLLFAFVRVTSLAHKLPFPGPLRITKLSGACLAIGQILLFFNVNTPSTIFSPSEVSAILAIMVFILGSSSYWFLARQNKKIFMDLFR